MESVTVRRWVPLPPRAVWDRLLELQELVPGDRTLRLETRLGPHAGDLEHPQTSGPNGGSGDADRSAVVALSAHGQRWLLTIAVAAMPGANACGSDVRLHAERDVTVGRATGPRSFTRRRDHRLAERIRGLLDELARQLDAAGPPRSQRMAPGRYLAASG